MAETIVEHMAEAAAVSELDVRPAAAVDASLADAASANTVAAFVHPSWPYLREAQTFPRLTPEQIARARAFGTVGNLPENTVLYERGDRTVDFFFVLRGHIEIHEPAPGGGGRVITLHAERQFTRELDLFDDRLILVAGRIRAGSGQVVRMDRAAFRSMLAAEPDVGEGVVRAFILRRVGFIEHGRAGGTLVASRRAGVGDSLRPQRFLGRNWYPVRVLDVDRPGARGRGGPGSAGGVRSTARRTARGPVRVGPRAAQAWACGARGVPGCAGGTGRRPGIRPRRGRRGAGRVGGRGLRREREPGHGGAGSRGVGRPSRRHLKHRELPGFPTGISGGVLAGWAQQAQEVGARIAVPRAVVRLDCAARPYAPHLDDGSAARVRTVVIATGASDRTLDLPPFDRFSGGNGIHWAATAIETGLCEREEVAVVGDGNSAGQAVVFLSRYAGHVHILVRGAGLAASMSDYMVAHIEASDRITLHTETEVTALIEERRLDAVEWTNQRTGAVEPRPIDHVFLMLGAVPNTGWLGDCGVVLDVRGFVQVGTETKSDFADPSWSGRRPHVLETSKPGIFAVGDVRAGSVKCVASAVHEGSIVVSSVHQVLAEA